MTDSAWSSICWIVFWVLLFLLLVIVRWIEHSEIMAGMREQNIIEDDEE